MEGNGHIYLRFDNSSVLRQMMNTGWTKLRFAPRTPSLHHRWLRQGGYQLVQNKPSPPCLKRRTERKIYEEWTDTFLWQCRRSMETGLSDALDFSVKAKMVLVKMCKHGDTCSLGGSMDFLHTKRTFPR